MKGGTLKSQLINDEEYPPYYYDDNGQPKDEFLPLSMTELILPLKHMMGRHDGELLDDKLFSIGGDRLNAQTGFAAMNILFLREHNRICGLLRQEVSSMGRRTALPDGSQHQRRSACQSCDRRNTSITFHRFFSSSDSNQDALSGRHGTA